MVVSLLIRWGISCTRRGQQKKGHVDERDSSPFHHQLLGRAWVLACEAGIWTAVVMFDLEVTWPPPSNDSRVGGYDFLGGEAEAQPLKTKRIVVFAVCWLASGQKIWQAPEMQKRLCNL